MTVSPLFSRETIACEPKATCALGLVAHGAAACRTTRARRATCETVDVAWLEPPGDPASDRCRTQPMYGATFQGAHVARDRHEARHPSLCMSLGIGAECDMAARPCRLSHVCRATWGTMHVARPERASVDPWPCGATCSTAHVASCDCGVRHGRAGMTMHRRGSGDIPSCEPIAPACWPASPWRSSASALGAGACALGRSSSAHSLKEPAPSDSSPSTRPPVSEELSGLLASR